MLQNTFIHLPGVGKATERELWESGVTTWEEFLDARSLPSRIRARRAEMRSLIERSVTRFDDADAWYFNNCLPAKERWRLYPDFRERAAFLDIETTGLSPESSYITMVGLLDSGGYTAYVKDENLDDLRAALEQYDLVVTFNGARFDLPYVEYSFGSVFRRMAHLDLIYPLWRLGYSGGLKAIESRLNVGRPTELSGLTGFDAVRMWRMWMRGNVGARDTLVRYNAEDVASLPALAEFVFNELAERLWLEVPPLESSMRHEIDLPYYSDVVRALSRGGAGSRIQDSMDY